MSCWNQSLLKFEEAVKNQPNLRRLQFHVNYFAKLFCVHTTLLSPGFSFNKVTISCSLYNFESRLIFFSVLSKHTFNIRVSNIVCYFLFQCSKYMERLMAWLFSFYFSCMACPILHCHLFSYHCLINLMN